MFIFKLLGIHQQNVVYAKHVPKKMIAAYLTPLLLISRGKKEYFGCKASWNYMEAGHGKGPCDPIGGTAKRKADQAVKNGKHVIQDAMDFYEWAKEDQSAITYTFLSAEEHEVSERFLQAVRTVSGTMKVHAVHSIKRNMIWVRDTSCFCEKCFNGTFQFKSCCDGWKECSVVKSRNWQTKNLRQMNWSPTNQ